ncbi:hypothetical protein DFJ73DRAFT_845550 [Zopfochytrium polystomum]|nr:hypothetical protein DFJ73DRAFT_845550 [Zopfochytrium polystomum]
MPRNTVQRSPTITNLPDDIVQPILLLATSHTLNRVFYKLAVVCRSFHRLLANEAIKTAIVTSHHHNLLLLFESCAGAPDLERLLVAHLTRAGLDDKSPKALSSLLETAVAFGFRELARLLLTKGADPFYERTWENKDWYNSSTAWQVADKEDAAMLQLLVDLGAAFRLRDATDSPLLHARTGAAHRQLLRSPTYGLGPRNLLDGMLNPGAIRLALALGVSVTAEDFAVMVVQRGWESEGVFEMCPIDCAQLLLDAGLDAQEMLDAVWVLAAEEATLWNAADPLKFWKALHDFLLARASHSGDVEASSDEETW